MKLAKIGEIRKITFAFKTILSDGLLMAIPTDEKILIVQLRKAQVRITIEHEDKETDIVGGLCDARWHNLEMTISDDQIVFSIEGDQKLSAEWKFGLVEEIFFGGFLGVAKSFVGCIKDVAVNSKLVPNDEFETNNLSSQCPE